MKLGNLVSAFLAEVCAGKSNETPQAYRSKLLHLVNYLGDDCEQIDQESIDRWKIELLTRKEKRRGASTIREPLSRFTCRTVMVTTRHFLRWAAKKKYLEPLELVPIREPSTDPKAIEALTVEQLLEAAALVGEDWEQARNTALIYVLRDTGGRAGAIAKMDIDNLYLAEGYATAPDKNDQLSWLYLNPPTIAAIRAWMAERARLQPLDYKLWTGAHRRGISRQCIGQVMHRLAKAAGITGRVNPHSFRHAFARDAILAGADLSQVSEMLGHRGIVVTAKYYARWNKREVRKFHKRFSPGRKLKMPNG